MTEFQDDFTPKDEHTEEKELEQTVDSTEETVAEETKTPEEVLESVDSVEEDDSPQPKKFWENSMEEPPRAPEAELPEEELGEKQKQFWENQPSKSEEKGGYNRFPAYFFAGFWVRLCSFIVDTLCISAITNFTIGFLFKLTGWSKGEGFMSVYSLLSLGIYLAYFILLTKLNHGQTIGKMIFGLKVVCFNEEELSWQTVILREGFCRFALQLNFWTNVAYLPAAFSKNKQHVGDMFCDTSVVTLNTVKASAARSV